jgi:hypothetical protein
MDVQTELYLEELSDRVEEADVEVQTDAFLDRPPSPMFVPAKTGVDIQTQIIDGAFALFLAMARLRLSCCLWISIGSGCACCDR